MRILPQSMLHLAAVTAPRLSQDGTILVICVIVLILKDIVAQLTGHPGSCLAGVVVIWRNILGHFEETV